jgi:hypothetical protein
MISKNTHCKCRKRGSEVLEGDEKKPRLEKREKRLLGSVAEYEMLERNICATTSIIQL